MAAVFNMISMQNHVDSLGIGVHTKNDLIYLILSPMLQSQFKHGSKWDLLWANSVHLDACWQADYPEPTEKHEKW